MYYIGIFLLFSVATLIGFTSGFLICKYVTFKSLTNALIEMQGHAKKTHKAAKRTRRGK